MAKKAKPSLKDIGEWGIIDWIGKNMPVNASGLIKGIGDDAAVLIGGEIITSDMLIEGVHFNRKWQDITRLGRKALAVNLSDIAAMGGFARCAFLNIAVPQKTKWAELETLLTGFMQSARDFGVAVAGGDTCSSNGPLVISVTVVGNTPRPVLRSGARPGDMICVTGTLGDAALALKVLDARGEPKVGGKNFNFLLSRLTDPRPRLRSGRAYGQYASAMIDLSDGLVSDLSHICRESSVGAVIDLEKVPLSEEYKFVKGRIKERTKEKIYREALYGGEDYELLFTVNPSMKESLDRAGAPVGYTEIGEVTEAAAGIVLKHKDREEAVDMKSVFKHF